MSPKVKKFLKVASYVILFVIIGILAFIGWKFSTDRENFKLWMEDHGALGCVVYVIMVFLQIVVALVPGGPIEVAGGYAFGVLGGTSLFMLGAFAGSLTVFLLVRKFGKPAVDIFFKDKEIKRLNFLKDDAKRNILFLILFIIPGSPKDLLCYVAGLTDMPIWFFVLITTIGRLPAVLGSAISGAALGESNFYFAALSLGIVFALSGVGIVIYYLISRKHKTKESDFTDEEKM
ncbi:MAG: TVP38/TMEM64 family protein [Lachnospiraceae bacterium]|nr:TVP38/TMEM64 family protein [Lachnospiraceae bacterium]